MVDRRCRGALVAFIVAGCARDAAPPVATSLAPVTAAATSGPPASATTWQPVLRGGLLEVEVERAGYDPAEPSHFYVRLRLHNLTAAPVGVDLRARRPGIWVNQWGVSELDHRTVIDEGRVVKPPLTPAAQGEVRAAFAAGQLTTIAAGATLDLYGAFNASGRAEVDASPGRWLLLALDGQFTATDGARIEQLVLGDDEAQRTLAIATPVTWRSLPAGAQRLPD